MESDISIISEYYFIPLLITAICLMCICCCFCNYCLHKYYQNKELPKYNNIKDLIDYNNSLKIPFKNKVLPTKSKECFICFNDYHCNEFISLDCKHNIHTACVVQWWQRQPNFFGSCPFCRQKSIICLLEIKKNNIYEMVGFYKCSPTHTVFIRSSYTEPTTFIKIPDSLKIDTENTCQYIYNTSLFNYTRYSLFSQ